MLPLSVAAAGIVAGWTSTNLVAAAAGTALAMWRPVFRKTVECGFVNPDPGRPDPPALMRALRLAVERTLETRRPVALRISRHARKPDCAIRLDLDAQGDLLVLRAGKPLAFGRPGLWLPDHPLPLALPGNRCTTLCFAPCENGRVRVTADARPHCDKAVWTALALLAAAACALDAAPALAAVLGFACGVFLLERQEQRAAQNLKIQAR